MKFACENVQIYTTFDAEAHVNNLHFMVLIKLIHLKLSKTDSLSAFVYIFAIDYTKKRSKQVRNLTEFSHL